MDRRNQGLLVFAIGILIFTAIMQRARSGLTPEQLHLLEHMHKRPLRALAPVIPLIICMLTISFFPQFKLAQAAGAFALSVLWFVVDAWRERATLLQAGLPDRYATTAFWSTAIVIASIVIAAGVAARGYFF
jgi:hypothetical protein